MAATLSTMIPLGSPAPDFTLPDPATGVSVSFADIRGERGTLVMFLCNHCPYVKLIADELGRLGAEYLPRGIGMVAISSNDAENYPEDAPSLMVVEKQRRNYPFSYLYDETQETALSYDAACTPDFFLFDDDDNLIYRGQFDEARPNNGQPVTGRDLRAAMNALIDGEKVPEDQTPSIGCNIKWKSFQLW